MSEKSILNLLSRVAILKMACQMESKIKENSYFLLLVWHKNVPPSS